MLEAQSIILLILPRKYLYLLNIAKQNASRIFCCLSFRSVKQGVPGI